jgi:hypothetical protein
MDIAFANLGLKNYDQFNENALKARKFFQDNGNTKIVKLIDILINKAKIEESGKGSGPEEAGQKGEI